jgi:hypothetical protein
MGTCRSVNRRAGNIVGSSFFSGVVTPSNSIGGSRMLLYADYARYVWSRIIRGSSVESVCRVGRVFPAGCISIRIAATLEYE